MWPPPRSSSSCISDSNIIVFFGGSALNCFERLASFFLHVFISLSNILSLVSAEQLRLRACVQGVARALLGNERSVVAPLHGGVVGEI